MHIQPMLGKVSGNYFCEAVHRTCKISFATIVYKSQIQQKILWINEPLYCQLRYIAGTHTI